MSAQRVNGPTVISQIFDTEVVVVNLESGSYYSVEGSGVEIWRLLEARQSGDRIVAALTDPANGSALKAEDINAFLSEAASNTRTSTGG